MIARYFQVKSLMKRSSTVASWCRCIVRRWAGAGEAGGCYLLVFRCGPVYGHGTYVVDLFVSPSPASSYDNEIVKTKHVRNKFLTPTIRRQVVGIYSKPSKFASTCFCPSNRQLDPVLLWKMSSGAALLQDNGTQWKSTVSRRGHRKPPGNEWCMEVMADQSIAG